MYELKSSRKSTKHKKIVAQIKQQFIKKQEFFCVYFRVILCYHSHNRKVKLESCILFNKNANNHRNKLGGYNSILRHKNKELYQAYVDK